MIKAVISGDIVASTSLSDADRELLRKSLNELLQELLPDILPVPNRQTFL